MMKFDEILVRVGADWWEFFDEGRLEDGWAEELHPYAKVSQSITIATLAV